MTTAKRLIQYVEPDGRRRLAVVISDSAVAPFAAISTCYEAANAAIAEGCSLAAFLEAQPKDPVADYHAIAEENRLLVPFDHPDPSHLLVTGTGLTHLGSADTRDSMHSATNEPDMLTDTMRMFREGLEFGRPAEGEIGCAPEWFYKGNGHSLVAPGSDLLSPAFARDHGEEPEIAGIYLVDPNGTPWRVGFALGNEFSDHVTERQNYLLLAHSKLRPSSFGPELRLGPLPADIRGTSRIRRGGEVIWEKPFLTGESNMSHSLQNLEHHHFKYDQHRVPGDVHVHFFGTATLSFADGINAKPGDIFELSAPGFGRALRSGISSMPDTGLAKVASL